MGHSQKKGRTSGLDLGHKKLMVILNSLISRGGERGGGRGKGYECGEDFLCFFLVNKVPGCCPLIQVAHLGRVPVRKR